MKVQDIKAENIRRWLKTGFIVSFISTSLLILFSFLSNHLTNIDEMSLIGVIMNIQGKPSSVLVLVIVILLLKWLSLGYILHQWIGEHINLERR